MTVMLYGADLNLQKLLPFFPCFFALVLFLIEKIHQTLKILFEFIAKHFDVPQKYSALRGIFNSLVT